MCGIFAYLSKIRIQKFNAQYLKEYADRIKHRGPDSTHEFLMDNLYFVFHRLAINGLDESSEQPFQMDNIVLICNGEIYNSPEIKEKYGDKYKSNSDCESIIHLYREYGATPEFFNALYGVYAFVLYDIEKRILFVGRDLIGVRPLFMGIDNTNFDICFASEAKAIPPNCGFVQQFRPGCFKIYDLNKMEFPMETWKFNNYWSIPTNICKYELNLENEIYIETRLRELLIEAVKIRLLSDRPIGALLSGGLDSTLVCAILCKFIEPSKLNTYSIGMKGSTDLMWARRAADYLGTNHTEFELSEEEFLDAIESTIYITESYCTTTIRASVGNYLVSKKIKEKSNDIVIFCGDVSDEIFASYRGFQMAKNYDQLVEANQHMLQNIHYFDVLRCDRTISGAGLEARVPFADRNLMEFVMLLPGEYKHFNQGKPEKYYLRKAFEGWLPPDILWRRKEAFSDGVSSVENSWHNIIKKWVPKISHYKAGYDEESKYYKYIYNKYYSKRELIPYYWKQPFSKNLDPSARLLDNY